VQLSNTQLNLSRTEIKAPYDGRVASEQVDIGQFIARGGVIAQLYATEQLEVRLPLADSQLGFLDPLILETGIYTYSAAPRVSLSASYAGKKHGWNGKLLRSEGAIDRQSRVVYVVAQVDDPKSQHGIDLPVGLFLEAKISGITVENAAVIPRSAVREGNRVLVISSDNTLHFRQIEVLRYENEHAVVTSGLTAGERICLSPLQYVVDGMSVTLAN
jgi:RND family efflux transporter MFP subunit